MQLYENSNKKEVVFEAADNGAGMTNDIHDRCLEPLYTTKEVGGGTGMGCSIVDTIVKEL